MYKWVVGAQQVAVQTEEENVTTKWTKREKALAVVLVILVGTVGIMWWHVCILTRNTEALCESTECIQQAAWMLSSVDPDADPCDNFYDFVCTSKIQSRERLIARDPTTSIEDFGIFTADSSETDLISTIARDVYNACMDSERSEVYFKEFFNSLGLDKWGHLIREDDTFDWRLFLYKARKHGLKYDMLFTFTVVKDEDNNAYLRIEPPAVNNASPKVIRIFNMRFVHDDSFFDETLRRMATAQEDVVLEMTIEELEYNYSSPSLESIFYITGHNFMKNDTIHLKSPIYFEKLKSQLTKDNISQSLRDYLMYEVVRSLVYEHQATFKTWQSKDDSKIEFCVSKTTDIVPFVTDLMMYKEETLEVVNIAEHILEEFLLIYGNSDQINDNPITIVTLNTILDQCNNFCNRLKHYMERQEKHNYMQLVTNWQKFKDDCYYSALDGDENSDLSCVLYNADDIKIHNNSLVIPAKIVEHSFYHTDGSPQLNYAGIGTLIGRVLIKELLKTRNASDTDETLQCLFDQQTDFYYIPNDAQEQEAEEMYTDVVGTQLAYKSYLKFDSLNPEKVLPGLAYTKTQLFWLTKFRYQCDYSNNFSQISVLPFVNIDNFTADFFCAKRRYMNPTSVPRCSLL